MARKRITTEHELDFEPDEFAGAWTERQRKFVRLMIQYENGARAAREAGYCPGKPEMAGNYAVKVLRIPHVATYLKESRKVSASRLKMDAEAVRQELVKIASSNLADLMKIGADGLPYLDLSEATRDQLAALKSFQVEETQENQGTREEPEWITVRKIKFELHDKTGALNSLGRHFKMFTDVVEANVSFGDENRILEARQRARASAAAQTTIQAKDGD